jgi:hypothetical protein
MQQEDSLQTRVENIKHIILRENECGQTTYTMRPMIFDDDYLLIFIRKLREIFVDTDIRYQHDILDTGVRVTTVHFDWTYKK